MKWNSLFAGKKYHSLRQIFRTLLLTGFIGMATISSLAATQGKTGSTSTGNFSITFLAQPSLRSQVAIVDKTTLDKQGSPLITPTNTLNFNRPTSFCVSGRGLTGFSLTVKGVPDVDLKVSDSKQTTLITDQVSPVFDVENNCKNSKRQLIAQPKTQFNGTHQPATLIIQVE